MSTEPSEIISNLIRDYFARIYQLERQLERTATLDRYDELAKESARLRQELNRVRNADEEFIAALEKRSMSSWSDAELKHYSVVTGQEEPSPAETSFQLDVEEAAHEEEN